MTKKPHKSRKRNPNQDLLDQLDDLKRRIRELERAPKIDPYPTPIKPWPIPEGDEQWPQRPWRPYHPVRPHPWPSRPWHDDPFGPTLICLVP